MQTARNTFFRYGMDEYCYDDTPKCLAVMLWTHAELTILHKDLGNNFPLHLTVSKPMKQHYENKFYNTFIWYETHGDKFPTKLQA
jgi:hypothetical protein